MTHIISIWPLSAALEFADTVPCYESQLMSEAEAQQSYAATTYAKASELDEWKANFAYLVSLDCLDANGIGICEQCRAVVK